MKTDSRRSDLIALALPTCCHCNGTGLRSAEGVCLCVERKCFEIVLRRYHDIVMGESFIAPISLANAGTGPRGLIRIGRPQEEFLADVICVARRALDTLEFSIFKFHYLYAADWKLCCQRLGLTRGECFHAFYRVEAKAGRAFRTTEPFPIYPVNGYLYGVVRGRKIPATVVDAPAPPVPLRPPMGKTEMRAYIRAKLAEQPLAA